MRSALFATALSVCWPGVGYLNALLACAPHPGGWPPPFGGQRRGEQPRMANIIIDKNKINKEPRNNRIANDRGVGSTNLLGFLYYC